MWFIFIYVKLIAPLCLICLLTFYFLHRIINSKAILKFIDFYIRKSMSLKLLRILILLIIFYFRKNIGLLNFKTSEQNLKWILFKQIKQDTKIPLIEFHISDESEKLSTLNSLCNRLSSKKSLFHN